MTLSDKECYTGYTALPSNGDSIESRVAVDKNAFNCKSARF